MPLINTATNIAVGSTQAKKVFQGTTQVWPPAPPNFQASWTNADMNTLTWGTNPFNPRSITGLTAWFDASDTLPITTQWYDKSLTGHHGTIYGSPAPTILQNMVGQLNVMRFIANEGRVRMTGTGITNDWTLLYVARQIGGSGRIASGGANNILVGWWGTQQDGAYDTTPGWLTPDVKITSTTAFTMYSADANPTTAMRLFKNGTLISSGSIVGNVGWGGTFNLNGQGADPGSTEMCNAEVCEVLFYNRKLSDTDRQAAETYLNDKWRGASSWPEYYEIYYSKEAYTTSADWMKYGTYLDSRNTNGNQTSYTHMKSTADKAESILYYALIKHNISTDTVSAPAISSTPRVRGGTDWKPYTIGMNSDKINALYQIPSGTTRTAALTASGGNYTVDWGDGTANTNHTAGTQASHTYAYASMPSAGEIAAGRQAMATISPQSGQTVTGFKINPGFTISPNPDSVANTHTVIKTDGTINWVYEWDIDTATWPVSKPSNLQTVWLRFNNGTAGTMTLRIWEMGGEWTSCYYYDNVVPAGPDYTNHTTNSPDSEPDPTQGFYIGRTLSAGAFSYLAATFKNPGSGVRKMKIVFSTRATGNTGGTPLAAYPVEITVASDKLRDLDVTAGGKHLNILSKFTATTFNSLFRGAALASINGELSCLSTSAKWMFDRCTWLTYQPRLTTTGITDFSYMWNANWADGVTTFPWFDTSSGTSFRYMFQSSWDSVTYQTNVCPAYDTRNGTDFSHMFEWAEIKNVPWMNTSNGTDFSFMYSDCEIGEVPFIDTSNGTNFESFVSFPWNDLTRINIPVYNTNKGTNFKSMFESCYDSVNFNVTSVANGVYFDSMYASCSSAFTNATIPACITAPGATSKGISFSYMFEDTNATSYPVLDTALGTNFEGMFQSCDLMTAAPALNTANGTNFGHMFYSADALVTPPVLNTSNGTIFEYMYRDCIAMTSLPTHDLSKAQTVEWMFFGCTSLPSNGTVSYNTPVCTNYGRMFRNCTNAGFTLAPLLPAMGTVSATCFEMFAGVTAMTTFPNYDLGKITDVTSMFSGCSALTSNGSKVYNTSSVSIFNYMFSNCNNAGFTAPPQINISTGTSFQGMFQVCPNITSFSQLTGGSSTTATNFSIMFSGCYGLTTANYNAIGLNLSNATNISSMFLNCHSTSFTSISLTTPLVTAFNSAFAGCWYLTSITLSTVSNGTNFASTFSNCNAIPSAGLPAALTSGDGGTSKGTNFSGMFNNCYAATFTTVPALNCSAGTNFGTMFAGANKITLVSITGPRYSISITTCAPSMSAANINTFLTNLGTADTSGGAQTVTINALTNSGSSNKAIATGKGWTIG